MAKDIAEPLGVHPVMLYRWRMENKTEELDLLEKVERFFDQKKVIF